jgi:polar amino acid transport system substrate-binding protein
VKGSGYAALAALSLGLVVVGGGCASEPSPPATLEPVPGAPDATPLPPVAIDRERAQGDSPYWQRIRAGEPLRISLNPHFPPFSMVTRDGERIGFDVELAEHLGATLDVPVEFVITKTRDQLDRLVGGRCDLVIAGLTRTVVRAAEAHWSDPYLVISQAGLVDRALVEEAQRPAAEVERPLIQDYFDLARLRDIRIGVKEATRPELLAKRFLGASARLQGYPTTRAAVEALVSGEVQAFVHDAPFIQVWLAANPRLRPRFLALLEPVTEEPICIAMRKGDLDFLRWLDCYIAEVRSDGTIAHLYKKYFTDMEWLRQVDLVD